MSFGILVGVGGTSNACPFKIYDASVDEDSFVVINSGFRGDSFAGAVDGVIATVNGVAIDYSGKTPPKLEVSDGDIVYVHVTKDSDGNTMTVEILADSELPDPDDSTPPTEGYMTIGSVSVTENPDGESVKVTPTNTIVNSLFTQICFNSFLWGT